MRTDVRLDSGGRLGPNDGAARQTHSQPHVASGPGSRSRRLADSSIAARGRRSSSAPASIATTRGTRSSSSPERHQALVWVSPMSSRCSFPERHPLFAGFLPAIREQIVKCLDGHDLIVAFGAPVFTYHIEGFGPHIPPGSDLIQMIDDGDVAAWTPVGTAIVCSVRHGVAALLERSHPPARPTPQGRSVPPPPVTPGDRISMAYLMQTLVRSPPAGQHHRRRIAVEPQDDADVSADRSAAQLLHVRERRARSQPASGRRRRACGVIDAEGHRDLRRRLVDVFDSGAVVGRGPQAARAPS